MKFKSQMEYTIVTELIDTRSANEGFNFIKLYSKEIPRKYLWVEITTDDLWCYSTIIKTCIWLKVDFVQRDHPLHISSPKSQTCCLHLDWRCELVAGAWLGDSLGLSYPGSALSGRSSICCLHLISSVWDSL